MVHLKRTKEEHQKLNVQESHDDGDDETEETLRLKHTKVGDAVSVIELSGRSAIVASYKRQ